MRICEHLKPILEHEEGKGNKIKEISEGWSKANLVIDLEKPIDYLYIQSNLVKQEYVRMWENNDTHYLVQRGFFCDKCKHSIAGPK